MAQIIPLLGGDSTIPLLGGVRGGSLGCKISVNISRISDLPTPKSPPKRGLSNSMRLLKIFRTIQDRI